MDISVLGLGYVGCVSVACLAKDGHKVIGVDTNINKVKQVDGGFATVYEKDLDLIFEKVFSQGRISATEDLRAAILKTEMSIITVGTPPHKSGNHVLYSLFKLGDQIGRILAEKDSFHTIIIRSTIKPGTSEKFSSHIERNSGKIRNSDFAIIYQPEFMREGSAVYDYYNPPYTVIGRDNNVVAKNVASLYEQFCSDIIYTDFKSAEFLKLVNNAFHALKVAFANEIGNISSALNIDSCEVMEIFCRDKKLNISSYYLKPGFAYGGSCLLKDLKQLEVLAHDCNLNTPILSSINLSNNLQIERAIEIITSLNKKKIGFLGLSFKSGTDDVRNSPAVIMAEILLKKNYEVLVYDKNILLAKLTGANKQYMEVHIRGFQTVLKDSLEFVIKESEVVIIINDEVEYIEELKSLNLREKTILDMVRIGEPLSCLTGYRGINW